MAKETIIIRLLALRELILIIGCVGLSVIGMTANVMGAEPVVIISRSDCARMTVHKPAADATYTPGVDVQGRPVAPADLPGAAQIAVPNEFILDVTVDIQKRYGIPNDAVMVKSEARVGTVVVKPDGSAYFNGQALSSPEQQALSALCQRQGTTAR